MWHVIKKKKKEHMLSNADLYLDKSNCDKVTLQLQQSMEVIYLPHQAISALSSAREGKRERERERERERDIWQACVSGV